MFCVEIFEQDLTKVVPNPKWRTHRKKRIQKKWNRGVDEIIVVPDYSIFKTNIGGRERFIMRREVAMQLREKLERSTPPPNPISAFLNSAWARF